MAEKAPKFISARWVGTYEAQLADGTVLVPGETVTKIPEPEVRASANWEPVGRGGKGGDS